MSSDLKSNLTAAKLKALCILNDLPTSGNKSDLVKRLLDSGLTESELEIEVSSVAVDTPLEAEAELTIQPSLSLEDEDTLTPDVEPDIDEQPPMEPVLTLESDDDVLDAEVLDAEFVTLEDDVKAPKTTPKVTVTKQQGNDAATLLDMVKQPKIAAAFVVVLILGSGTCYYFNNQL